MAATVATAVTATIPAAVAATIAITVAGKGGVAPQDADNGFAGEQAENKHRSKRRSSVPYPVWAANGHVQTLSGSLLYYPRKAERAMN